MDELMQHPLPRLVAQVVVVVALSRLLGVVTRAAKQPLVVAEILAGIALGPSLLGWLAPDVSRTLFAPESLGTLGLVSQLGLVLFMFLIGLELDPRLLRGRGHTSVAISHASIVLPFGLGIGLASWMHADYGPPGVAFLPFALFMGVAMSITAFPVLARILAERRLMGTRVGAITIACAAVDDVTAWCLLAFVVAYTRTSGIESALVTTALALGYIAFMWFVVRPLLRRLAARVSGPEGPSQNAIAVILVLVFASSWVTEFIGIHALFGGFLFGAMLPKQGGFARAVAEKIEDLVVIVLLPLFFAYSGLRTQLGLLATASDWAMCALVIGFACLGKFGGSFVAARLTGLSWRESGALGILMNTRGLMELIVLNIGLDLGVISPTLFSMMVIMALVTTFMTTPLLAVVYPDAAIAKGLIRALPAGPAPAPGSEQPFGVLVCVSRERNGPGLVAMAAALAPAQQAGGRIDALHLIPPRERGSARLGDRGTRPGARPDMTLAPALARAAELGVEVEPLAFATTEPSADICRVADVRAHDLVLLGGHRPLLGQALLGGVVFEVMRDAQRAVAVFVDRGLSVVRRVVVPWQGAPHDRAALAIAARLVSVAGAKATILRSDGGPVSGGVLARLVRDLFGAHADTVEVVRVDERAGRPEEAVELVLGQFAEFDLLVTAVGREWGLEERRFGLLPERLVHAAPTSVLIVRGGEAHGLPQPVRGYAATAAETHAT